MKNSAIFSFDIFDTLITRIVAQPQDVFLFMQAKLDATRYPAGFVQNFPAIRMEYARLAHQTSKKEDVALEEIYFCLGKQWNLNPQAITELRELELATEEASLYPIAPCLKELKKARAGSSKIIFVSDMYLPTSFIKKLLVKAGAFSDSDGLYISGEIGLTKSSGNLFKHVLKTEGCVPQDICHFGDNSYNDIFVPHQLGIKLHQWPGENLDPITRSLYYKVRWLKESLFKKY